MNEETKRIEADICKNMATQTKDQIAAKLGNELITRIAAAIEEAREAEIKTYLPMVKQEIESRGGAIERVRRELKDAELLCSELQQQRDSAAQASEETEQLVREVDDAIDVLDGNMELENLGTSELHRKLKEHLLTSEQFENVKPETVFTHGTDAEPAHASEPIRCSHCGYPCGCKQAPRESEKELDPYFVVPSYILEAADKVAAWATQQGWKRGWAIGPVADRAAHTSDEVILRNWPKIHKAIRSDIMLSGAAEEIHAMAEHYNSLKSRAPQASGTPYVDSEGLTRTFDLNAATAHASEPKLAKATTEGEERYYVPPPAQANEPWRREAIQGIDRLQCRIMCGDKQIVGWSAGFLLEVIDKIIAAHNATLQPAQASEVYTGLATERGDGAVQVASEPSLVMSEDLTTTKKEGEK